MNRRATRIAVAVAVVIAVGGVVWVVRGAPDEGSEGPTPRFVDEASAAGVDHRYSGEFEHFVGGGVAVLDCDGDALPDLYFAGGAGPAALYRNASEVGGALAFERVRDAATDLDRVTGAYPLDVDADGHTDLVVLRYGENVLLRGSDDCRFERANELWNVDGGEEWTTAFSATWEGDAVLPTMAFGNYLVPDESPSTFDCDESVILRPDGERYGTPHNLGPGYCPLSMLFSDWGRTGRRDLRVSNDRHYARDAAEQLWRIDPDDAPRLYTEADGWQTLRIWGMGIASRDLTGDGRPEVYLTSQGDNKLQTLVDPDAGEPTYTDIALERGVTATRPYTGEDTDLPSTGWHPEFGDVNNDGLVDLFVSKGNVEAMADFATTDPSNLFIGQPDGTFVEGAPDAGITAIGSARGAALADLNLDGLLDLVLVNRREPVQVWRNLGAGTPDAPEPMGHWLALRLEQDGPNRDAIGAWVEIRAGNQLTQVELIVGGGHVSGQAGWTHIGLGDSVTAEVTVTWPDGERGEPLQVEADGFAVIERGAGARFWSAREGDD
jgi:hypothetical protein